MANSCITGIKFSREDYQKIASAMYLGLDWQAVVRTMYKPAEANSLIEAIEVAEAIGQFDENWVPSEEIEKSSSEDPHILFNGAEDGREQDNIASYYTERRRGWSEERRMVNKFIDDVLSRVLYDKNSGGYQYNQEKNINQWLYNYKLELLRNLWSVTGMDHESEITPETFNKVINQTIIEFGSVSNSERADQYYNDYIILKQFNNLLSKYTPFIKINAAYRNLDEHGIDMYYWDPSGKYRSNWTNTEDVDVEKITSPVVKILLNYFPTISVNGDPLPRKIGFTTFNTVMASILTWIHQNRTLNINAKKVSDEIRSQGLSYNFSKMIDVYMSENPNLNEGMKDVLRGIKKYIFSESSAMPLQLKQAFANQFFITAKYSYMSFRLEYDAKGHKFDVAGKYLEDGFIDIKRNNLMRLVKTRVRFLRNAKEKQNTLFDNLLNSNYIRVEDDPETGSIDIIFDKEHYGTNLILSVKRVGDNISISDNGVIEDLDDSAVVDLIQKTFQTFIPDNYDDIITSMTSNDVASSNLFMLFRAPIAILYGAAFQTNEGIFDFDDETKELKTFLYKNRFADAAHFQGIVSGVNELSVWKNGEGNNLPIFQLAPAIFDIFDIIDRFAGKEDASKALSKMFYDELNSKLEDETIKNVYAKNPYILYPEILRRIVARSDAKIQGKVKTSAKMSVTEVASRAIFNEFYGSLMYEVDSKRGRSTNDELLHCILMQPITFSDKTTHYLPVTDLDKIYIKLNDGRNVNALTIFRELTKVGLDANSRKIYLDALKTSIRDYQYDKSKNILFNQYLRFRNVFKDTFDEKGARIISDAPGLSIDRFNPELAFKEIVKVLNYINADPNIVNGKDWIRRKFDQANTLFNEDYDVRFIGKEINGKRYTLLQANETLFYNLFTGRDPLLFDKHLDRAIRHFASNLGWYDIKIDLITDPQFRAYMDGLTSEQKNKWIDTIAGTMKSFIAYRNVDGHKVPVDFNVAEIDSNVLFDSDIEIELNPIFESYFYAHNMFSPAINDILFGDTGNYAPKKIIEVDFNSIDPFDSRIEEMMAGALSMEFKRTTYAGAVKRKFATVGVKFGVPEYIRFAGIDTSVRNVSTIRGETHRQKTQDGNGWVDPILARMIQKSLVGSPVGDVRKTIAGWNDPTTGCQVNFKWAEDTITTYLRQRSEDVGSVEMMFRKGRRFDISEKFRKIKDFSVYYNPSEDAKKYSVAGETITHTKYIYRKNIDTGTYWRLDLMEIEDGFLTGTWTRVNERGVAFDNEAPIKSDPIEITNLYELDNAFGGAWVFDLIDGNMVASEATQDILYHIVCTNGMENDFIGYFVGREACKSGAFNFNPYSRLSNNDEELSSYFLRGDTIGVLQNSDHELDFSSVTEMSQMILLLTQTGDNVDLVNQMYEDIGRVANEALQSIILNLDNEKEIYRVLGKALIDSFDTRTKDELGIAQAFIKSAQATLDANGNLDGIILPYSAETIKGAFIATVTSMINKKGIRRKYAGFGGVEVGAEDTMVHYDIDGQHLTYEAVRDHYRPLCRKFNVTWEQIRDQAYINGRLNPTFVSVNRNEVGWGDTVFIRLSGDTTGGREIKIDTQYEFDLVTALLRPVGTYPSDDMSFKGWEIYKWPTRSKQLEQSDLRWVAGGMKISEYNLDSVRASFYLDELSNFKKGKNSHWGDEFDTNRKNVIRAAITNEDIPVQLRIAYEQETGQPFDISVLWATNKYDNLIPELKKLLNNKTSNYLSKLSRIAKSEVRGKLPTQMVETYDFPEIGYIVETGNGFRPIIGESEISPIIEKRVSQIAMGRKNFDKFLLRKGDRLDKIKKQGPQFFFERLTEKQTSYDKIRHDIKNFPYDGLLNLSNGETMLVTIGHKSSSQLQAGQDFVRSTDAISYKGRVIIDNTLLKNVGNVSEIILNSIISESGKIVPVVTVKDFDTFNRLRKSSEVVHSSIRYHKGNWKNIIKSTGYTTKVNWAGVEFDISPDTVDEIDGDAEQDIIRQLNIRQRHINRDRLKEKAEILYRNFIAQLNYIQTRIPSQAMQSTMALEVVDIVDTDTNYLWVPLITHLLQGSDLDIDKGYCMGYDIDDSGNIYSESDLIYDPTYKNVDDILLLDVPNFSAARIVDTTKEPVVSDGIVIDQNTINNILTKGASNNWEKINYLRAILELTKPYARKTIYFDLPTQNIDINLTSDPFVKARNILKQAIIDMNTHNMSNADERRKAGALRNRVFAAARKIITDPASQMDHMLPVSLEEARAAASKSSLGQKEKSISIADPMTIFMMQQQNMSGKNVIALTATGIKSYFIITTHFNMIARNALNLIDELLTLPENSDRSHEIINEVAELFNQITFDSIFNPNGNTDDVLRTFANINFKEILERLNDEKVRNRLNNLQLTKTIETLPSNKLYNDYISGNVFKFADLIEHLNRVSNGNVWIQKVDKFGLPIWEYFVVNASDSLGSLLNAATDNAKELVLEKLNASEKFADYYIALLAMGYKFDDIADKMTTGAFRIVSRYAQDNIFNTNTHKFNTERAIDFVLDRKELPNISKGMFDSFLINAFDNNMDGQHFNGFLKTILDLDPVLMNGQLLSDFLASNIKMPSDDELGKTQLSSLDTNKNKILSMAQANRFEWNRILANGIYKLFKEDAINVNEHINLADWMKLQLMRNLTDSVNASQTSDNAQRIADEELQNSDYNLEPDVDPSDFLDGLISEDMVDDVDEVDTQRWYSGREYRTADLIKLYRYAKHYFLPKNDLWLALSPENRVTGENLLMEIKDKITHATREIKMLGGIGSINQGMKVSDFDEYKIIERINKFINSAYIYRGNGEITEEFDLIKYLSDDEKDYHDRQVKNYDKVKVTINILRAIDYTANFKEMFKYMALNRRLIERSIAVKLERALAREALLTVQEAKEGQLNQGLTKSFGQDEFKVLTHYTRDLIILNFFLSSDKSLRFSIPSGEECYKWSLGKYNLEKHLANNPKPMYLSTVDGLASFKHLMDWYIIPKLLEDERPSIKNNKFIRNLVQDDIAVDSKSKKPITAYKLNIPIINLTDQNQMDDYADLLYDFNQLLYQPLGKDYGIGNWTIGDLFFIYNLTTYKDRIGGNSMTRLFEDAISSNNRRGLPAMYYRYINDLDRRINNIFDENGNINSNKFAYDLADLYYRLADLPSADWLFGISLVKAGNKTISEVNTPVENGIDVITDPVLLSDFVFGMPKIMEIKDFTIKEPTENYTKGFNKTYNKITASAPEVINALIQELQNRYDNKVEIEALNADEIKARFINYSDNEIDQLLSSPGFVINGKIYINTSKLSLETPMHELIHFISAGLKFGDAKSRKMYYDALQMVDVWWNTTDDNKLKEEIMSNYGNRIASDRKEEILAMLLSLAFRGEFNKSWGTRTVTEQLLQANIKSVLADVLNTDRIKSENSEDIANEKLKSVMISFASQLIPMTSNQLSSSILLSKELAELKKLMYDKGLITLENCI